MKRNAVRRLRKITGIAATRGGRFWLRRAGVGSLALVCVASFSCSPAENTQPRNTPSAQGGSSAGSNATTGGASIATTGGVATTTGGGRATGGSGTGGAMGGSVGSAGTAVGSGGSATGSGGSGQGGASGNGGSAKGGAVGATTGGSPGPATGGKSSSGGGSTGGDGNGGGGAGGVGGSAGSAGAAGAATCPGFVFCDTFEDGNLTTNPVWLATAGAFSVIDDGGSKVLKQTGSSEAWAYSGSATWTDVTIQARVKVLDFMGTSSTNCAGLIARWQGSSNPSYMASLCAKGTVGIYKGGDLVDETNGTKAANIVANTWYDLKLKVSGKPGSVSLVLSIDDAPLITITDSDTSKPVTAGYVALGSKKAFSIEYDDVKVSSP